MSFGDTGRSKPSCAQALPSRSTERFNNAIVKMRADSFAI
jgi:hypothetical protein